MTNSFRQTHRDRGEELTRSKTKAPDWTLPAIVSVEISNVHFDKPRVQYVAGKRITQNNAVQITVRLDGQVPFRAAPPVLLVGDHRFTAFDRKDDGAYDFYGYEPEKYCSGAMISLAWADFPAPQEKSDHRYEAP